MMIKNEERVQDKYFGDIPVGGVFSYSESSDYWIKNEAGRGVNLSCGKICSLRSTTGVKYYKYATLTF